MNLAVRFKVAEAMCWVGRRISSIGNTVSMAGSRLYLRTNAAWCRIHEASSHEREA